MSLLNRVCRYFKNVTKTSDFVIAIDETGVYFFTEERDQDEILFKASAVVEALELSKGEFIICIVSESVACVGKKFFDYGVDNSFSDMITEINPEEFEDVARRMTGGRPVIYSMDDLNDISSCFDRFAKYDCGNDDYLAQFMLAPEIRNRLDSYVPESVQDVIACGVPGDIAESVYVAMRKHECKQDSQMSGHFDNLDGSVSVISDNRARNFIAISLIMFVISAIGAMLEIPAMVIIFSVGGLWFANDLSILYRTFWSSVCKALNAGILLTGVCQGLVMIAPYARAAFEQAGLLTGR